MTGRVTDRVSLFAPHSSVRAVAARLRAMRPAGPSKCNTFGTNVTGSRAAAGEVTRARSRVTIGCVACPGVKDDNHNPITARSWSRSATRYGHVGRQQLQHRAHANVVNRL